MFLLRNSKVNILRYLPGFLAKDKNFKSVGDSSSTEHERLRLAIIDVCKQFFVDTATWGLDDWERVFEIKPPAGASYETRRNLIKSKMLAYPSLTVKVMEQIANCYINNSDNLEKITIKELNELGSFIICVPGNLDILYNEMNKAINDIKPAHLGFWVRFIHEKQMPLYFGGITQNHQRTTIYPQIQIPKMDEYIFFGGIIHTNKTITIYSEGVN